MLNNINILFDLVNSFMLLIIYVEYESIASYKQQKLRSDV